MTHAKFNFNQLMLTLIFGIRASEPLQAWRTTEKAGPDRVKVQNTAQKLNFVVQFQNVFKRNNHPFDVPNKANYTFAQI